MNLPSLNNSEIKTMSSREIAELTGKEKANVHRDIKSQLLSGLYGLDPSNLNHEQIQGLTIIPDERGYWFEVQLDRYHTDILVSGYEVKYRAKIIKRWHELENQIQKPKVVSTAEMIMLQAQWNLDQERKLLAVEKTVENQAVQLEEVNDDIAMVVKEIEGVKKLVLDSSISLSEIYADENAVFEIGEVAGMLIGSGYFLKEKDFRLYLLEKKLCYKHGQNYYYPMARLLKEGYVKVIPVKVGIRVFSATHFTPRGISWIVKRLQKEQQRELVLGYVESDSAPVLVDSSPTTVVGGF
jgi:phage regulator Rha-like protein/phage antirepressor YoqD-like protein